MFVSRIRHPQSYGAFITVTMRMNKLQQYVRQVMLPNQAWTKKNQLQPGEVTQRIGVQALHSGGPGLISGTVWSPEHCQEVTPQHSYRNRP